MIRLSSIIALMMLGAPANAGRPTHCTPLPGIEAVLAKPDIGFLLFGEYHGTIDMPALVGDAICAAAATGRPLVIGIELASSEQPAIDAFMASRGTSNARAALLSAPVWQEEGGRTTRAIADLLETARRLGKHHPVRAVAFDALPQPGTSARREQAMADALKQAGDVMPGTLVIALTGIGHADRTGWASQTPPFASAVQLLPDGRTVTLAFARPGGNFWGCHPANGGEAQGCRSYPMPVREPVSSRGITLDANARPGFDGIYSVGRQYRASRPARD